MLFILNLVTVYAWDVENIPAGLGWDEFFGTTYVSIKGSENTLHKVPLDKPSLNLDS